MSRSTAISYHTVQDFRTCPRRFWLRHVLGFEARSPEAASMGTACHAAAEVFRIAFHNGEGTEDEWARNAFEAGCASLEEAELFDGPDLAKKKLAQFVSAYVNKFNDEGISLEGIEYEIKAQLGEFDVSGRLDALFFNPESHSYLIKDLKTSSSVDARRCIASEMISDQFVFYQWLVGTMAPTGTPVDVQIEHAKLLINSCEVTMIEPFSFSDEEINEYIEGLQFTLEDIKERLDAVKAGHDPGRIFYRSPDKCTFVSCPYSSICRGSIDECPPGFTQATEGPYLWQ